jgi:hypothetical protein
VTESIEQFRSAWLSLEGETGFLADLQRRSLIAAARGAPHLEAALADLQAPQQAELDLHIAGGSVQGHETLARPFGQFVTRVATAVKEIAKSVGGKERYATKLRVLAPSQGSVRVVMRAPEIRRPHDVIPGDREYDSLDSLAVKHLAAVLAHADDAQSEDSPLVASIQALRGPARIALRQVARSVEAEGWEIEGVLRQRGHDPSRIRLTPSGASMLIDAASDDVGERQQVTLSGVIDGQRRSLSAMWFQPDSGRAFEAAVTQPGLLDHVAELAALPDQRVRAVFTVFVRYGEADSEHARRSYELTDLEPLENDAELPFGELLG